MSSTRSTTFSKRGFTAAASLVLVGAACAFLVALWLLSLRELSFSACAGDPPSRPVASRVR